MTSSAEVYDEEYTLLVVGCPRGHELLHEGVVEFPEGCCVHTTQQLPELTLPMSLVWDVRKVRQSVDVNVARGKQALYIAQNGHTSEVVLLQSLIGKIG